MCKALLFSVIAALLVACAPAPAPLPTGPWHALNWGNFQPSAAEVATLPK